MTFPFGIVDGLISNGSARSYTLESIKRFEKFAQPIIQDYYEYQYSRHIKIYTEYPQPISLHEKLKKIFVAKKHMKAIQVADVPSLSGAVTWRRIPLQETKATQYGHVDGVLCGVWKKR